MTAPEGFHEGELTVQQRAGVRGEAARLEGMLDSPDVSGGARRFLADRDFAVITTRDRQSELWITPLYGRPGFLNGHDQHLTVHAVPDPASPLAGLQAGQPAGMVAIDFMRRRRVRINGILSAVGPEGFDVDVEQAYGNCPQYIHPHSTHPDTSQVTRPGKRNATLDDAQRHLIEQADTFFLGTIHPTRGADASHRGGDPGFVHVEESALWWPDYAGNNMFNSFGNLAVDDSAALLFLDFTTGAALHLSGSAAVEWATPTSSEDTGRRVRFSVRQVAT